MISGEGLQFVAVVGVVEWDHLHEQEWLPFLAARYNELNLICP
jgi:hypothetical protein